MKWKVCGLRDLNNIREVAACAPDFLGFIWVPNSPRYVGEDFCIPPGLGKSQAVGVFRNQSQAVLVQKAKQAGFEILQLHGQENQDQVAALKALGLKVIKAISLSGPQDLPQAKDWKTLPDYFLFDSKVGTQEGGTGQHFDWTWLEQYRLDCPYLLAGGLSAEDLVSQKAWPQGSAFQGLDFNSKLESAPGFKDIEKVKRVAQAMPTL